jgi:hypothetical protein
VKTDIRRQVSSLVSVLNALRLKMQIVPQDTTKTTSVSYAQKTQQRYNWWERAGKVR